LDAFPENVAVKPVGNPLAVPIPVALVVVKEIVGDKVVPIQSATLLNGDVTVFVGFMVILNDAVEAQVGAAACEEIGLNVYAVVAVLFIEGVQVPEIPLFELVGNGAMLDP
jgi:hypothetical protein